MKFVSKSNNLRIVLRPGVPSERITGRIAIQGLYIKFEGGVVNVVDEETIKLMLAHPGYGTDFFDAEIKPKGMTMGDERSSEPAHDVMEIENGYIKKNLNPKAKITLTPEMKQLINEMAVEVGAKIAEEKFSQLKEGLKKELQDKVDIKEPAEEKVEIKKEN